MKHYFVSVNNNEIKVCRSAFVSIHGISRSRLEVLTDKRRESPTGTPVLDKRGKMASPRAITGVPLDCIHEHISSLVVTASHYTRAHSPHRRYMEGGLTIAELHNSYILWMLEKHPGVRTVSPRFYKTVFTRDYNIVFRPPKTDLCNRCEQLKASIEEKKAKKKDFQDLTTQLQEHQSAAGVPQDLLSRAEANSKVALPDCDLRTVAIDLQQTLPCPRLRTSSAYYKRKVWVYNFCIYDMNKDKANMFVWEESTAKRGSDEIASCIMKWVERELREGHKFRRLRIYADNCAGQNKNIHIVLMALRLIHAKTFDKVEFVFMVPGHSFLPCDRAFGHIERKIRAQPAIFCPADYLRIIKYAVGKENIVTVMIREDFFHFRTLKDQVPFRPQTGFAKARQLVIDANYPQGYIQKNTYLFDMEVDGVDKRMRLMAGTEKNNPYSEDAFNLAAIDLPLKYPGVVKLVPEKLKDLKMLWYFLDVKGRRWVDETLLFQGQDPMQPDDDSEIESELEDEHDDGWEYVDVVRLRDGIN